MMLKELCNQNQSKTNPVAGL